MKFLSVIGCLAILFFAVSAFPDASINMEAIRHIESSRKDDAVSYRGAKYGRGAYQVSETCLQEFNDRAKHPIHIRPEWLFEEPTCRMVASWYVNVRIPQMLRRYGLEVTTDTILWAYNAGIKAVIDGRMPDETKEYIRKYNNYIKEGK